MCYFSEKQIIIRILVFHIYILLFCVSDSVEMIICIYYYENAHTQLSMSCYSYQSINIWVYEVFVTNWDPVEQIFNWSWKELLSSYCHLASHCLCYHLTLNCFRCVTIHFHFISYFCLLLLYSTRWIISNICVDAKNITRYYDNGNTHLTSPNIYLVQGID